MANIQTPEFERLMEVVIKLETKEEALNFFEDICTIKEIQDMSQRFQVAEMLHQNKSYIEISKGTGACHLHRLFGQHPAGGLCGKHSENDDRPRRQNH